MVRIISKRLGPVDIDETITLQFPAGLPGFEQCTRIALVERPSAAPLVFLQSLDLAEVCFLAAPVTTIDPEYQLSMTLEDLDCLGLESRETADDLLCLAILAPSESGKFTANLLAPVVIHQRTRRGVQAVRIDSRYSHQHPLGGESAPCS
jgi:flagellar assembly factor FliW